MSRRKRKQTALEGLQKAQQEAAQWLELERIRTTPRRPKKGAEGTPMSKPPPDE